VTNTVNTVTQIADHAAMQSDRWLFLASLIVGLLGAVAIARWIVADRNRVVTSLENNQIQLVKIVEKVTDVVSTNTSALNRVSEEIRFCAGRGNGRGHEPIA
jgi:hypothetical protein